MRPILGSIAAFLVGLGISVSTAQVYQLPTPPPQVTAANVDWQIRGELIFYAGDFYYPTGPTVFFDGNVMVRSGVYEGIPLYADSTLEPYSVVYVPIGRNLMRPYERRRTGQLAGTTGSRTPSFPIEHNGERELAVFAGKSAPGSIGAELGAVPESPRSVGATGALASPSTSRALSPVEVPALSPVEAPPLSSVAAQRSSSRVVESTPAGRPNLGFWIPFNGSRWYVSDGTVPYAPDQFGAIGMYHGFPVYQRRGGSNREIYIPSVDGGPLARYQRR